jgi:hypothetical protein
MPDDDDVDVPDLRLPPHVAAELAPSADRLAEAREAAAQRAYRYMEEFDGEEAEKRAAHAERAARRSRRMAELLHRWMRRPG